MWWTTVGVAYLVGALLVVAIVLTESSPAVGAVAAVGSLCAAAASARLLERGLPDRHASGVGQGRRPGRTTLLVVLAVAGGTAALAAAQWSDTVMGVLPAGLATAGTALVLSARLRGTIVGVGAAVTAAVVAGARRLALGEFEVSPVADQSLLLLAVAGGLVVTMWFWELVQRLEAARQLEGALAVADERLRFAADLHDIQGHHLQVIALESELATRLVDRDPAAAASHMAGVHEHAQRALSDTRQVVQGYRKTPLSDELGNATRVLGAAGIDGRAEHGADAAADRIHEPGRQLLGLVVREATTNILRHSDARQARFRLDVDAASARLVIQNDGAAPSDRSDGSGLTTLSDRLEDAGGGLDWWCRDNWFTVTATVAQAVKSPA